MGNGNDEICERVRSALNGNDVKFEESEIQNATKFTAHRGANSAPLNVFNTGKITIGGKESPLKTWLINLKTIIESGTGSPATTLPVEIEKYPQTLEEKVPSCDPVIAWFFREAMHCYKANSLAGAAFMLGAASEKAILLLVESYGNSIRDEANRDSFFTRTNNRPISQKYDNFKKSYAGCKSEAIKQPWAQDLSFFLDGAFHCYRITRNGIGHPQIIPDLDQGIVLANIGNFITYVERIYCLRDHFEENGVIV